MARQLVNCHQLKITTKKKPFIFFNQLKLFRWDAKEQKTIFILNIYFNFIFFLVSRKNQFFLPIQFSVEILLRNYEKIKKIVVYFMRWQKRLFLLEFVRKEKYCDAVNTNIYITKTTWNICLFWIFLKIFITSSENVEIIF